MTKKEFIENIAKVIQEYAPEFGIRVYSPIIAQACLESAYGASELGRKAYNYFGLKYRKGRMPSASGTYKKVGAEQGKDGKYTVSMMTWARFDNLEKGVRGYFEFINTDHYINLKGVTDPEKYLKNIKADGYATSLRYVENLMRVIEDNNLTRFDQKEGNEMVKIREMLAHASNHGGTRSKISYIVLHYTANDGDTDTANAKYFQGKNRKASAHYFVDDDSITRSVKDNVIAWAVGGGKYPDTGKTGGGKYYKKCTNTNSISIEMCDTKKDGKYNLSSRTRKNTIDLVVTLMKKYKIDIEHVIRHFDVTGKKCPVYWASKENPDWLQFKKEVTRQLHACHDKHDEMGVKEGKKTYPGAWMKLPERGYYKIGDGYKVLKDYKPQIKRLQKFLKWAVGISSKIDGQYGKNTEAAVIRFQKLSGVKQTGQFDKLSLKYAKKFEK